MLNAQCCLFLCSDILTEDTEGEGLGGNGSPLRTDCAENKAQHDPQSHKEFNKDLSKVTPHWAISQLGNKTPNAAKTGEAKSSLSQNRSKTSGVACSTDAVTSKMAAPPQEILPSKMHIPPLKTPAKPMMSTPPSKMETITSSPKITPQQKAVPMIPATNGPTATTQNRTPKITQAPVPFKVSSPSTATIQTSVAGSTPLTTNQKNPALRTAPVTTSSSTMVTSMSSLPRFNVTENAAPPSSVRSAQKASLGVPVAPSQSKGMPSFKPQQSPLLETVDTKLSQPNGTITKPIQERDELLPPKTTGLPVTSLVASTPKSPPESPAAENVAPSYKSPNAMTIGAPVAAPQILDLDKSLTKAKTTNTLATKLSTFSYPSPSAASSFLKQVYSCPDSLQR